MIEQDRNEPPEMFRMLGQVGKAVIVGLNDLGWADYRWQKWNGVWRHVERKQWGELVNTEKVEEQLYRHLTKQKDAELTLLVEGVVKPVSEGMQVFNGVNGNRGNLFVPGKTFKKRLGSVQSWLYQVGKWVEVVCTSDLVGSANMLVSMHDGDQKQVHHTFNRNYRVVEFRQNPQVSILMGLEGVGEKTAVALIRRFGTVYNVLRADPVEMAEVVIESETGKQKRVGLTLSRQVLAKVGRADV